MAQPASNTVMKRGGGRIHLSTHVAAIALNKDKEALAEELMHKQEHNLELQQQVKRLMTDKRHLEVEVNNSKQALLQLLHQHNPSIPVGQPMLSLQEQATLLGTLQQQEQDLQDTLAASRYEQAMAGHLACVLQQVRDAAEAAAEADDPDEGNNLAHDLLQLLEAFPTPTAAPSPSTQPVSSLAVAQAAHKVLLQQALLLRGRLPSPVPFSSGGSARPRSPTGRPRSPVGSVTQSQRAQDVLLFLRTHARRMQDLLHTLSDGTTSPPRSRCASPDIHQQRAHEDPPQHRARSAQPAGALIYKSSLYLAQDPQQVGSGKLGLLGPVGARPQSAASSGRLLTPQHCQSARPSTSRALLPTLPARFGATAVGIPHPSGRFEGGGPDGLPCTEEGALRPFRKEPMQGTAACPDLRPYLSFPPKRPGSPVSPYRKQQSASAQRGAPQWTEADVAAVNSSALQELQAALTEREGQLQLQQRQCWRLNEELQEALRQLAHAEGQLCAADAQAVASTAASTDLQAQVTALEQAAAEAAETICTLQAQLAVAEHAAAANAELQERIVQAEQAGAKAAAANADLQERLAAAEKVQDSNAALQERLSAAEQAASESGAALAVIQSRLAAAEQAAQDNAVLQEKLAVSEQATAEATAAAADLRAQLTAAEQALAASDTAETIKALQDRVGAAEQAAADSAAAAVAAATAHLQEKLTAAEQAVAQAALASAALQAKLAAAEQAATEAHGQAKQKDESATAAIAELQAMRDSRADAAKQQDSTAKEQLLAAQDTIAAQAKEVGQLQQQLAAAEALTQDLQQKLQVLEAKQHDSDAHSAEAAAAQASQITQMQQQLAAAEAQVLDLQQQLHTQQVQYIQAEQEWQQELASASAQQQAGAAGTSDVASRAQLAMLLQSHAEHLAGCEPVDALLDESGELQQDVMPLCEALQRLSGTMTEAATQLRQDAPTIAARLSSPAAGRISGSTAALEVQLEATAAEMDHCMDVLTEVVAAARRHTTDWPQPAGGAAPKGRGSDDSI